MRTFQYQLQLNKINDALEGRSTVIEFLSLQLLICFSNKNVQSDKFCFKTANHQTAKKIIQNSKIKVLKYL